MKTIINTSAVTDYSGEPPIVTYSNSVTTVIRQTPPKPIITRIFMNVPCNCCNCCCGWQRTCCDCGCNCNCGRQWNCCDNF